MRFFKEHKSGVVISIKVIPASSKNMIEGVCEDADGQEYLRIKVTEVPEKGKANKLVLKLLAKEWGFAPSSLEIISKPTNKHKSILVYGDTQEILNFLDEMY